MIRFEARPHVIDNEGAAAHDGSGAAVVQIRDVDVVTDAAPSEPDDDAVSQGRSRAADS